MYGAYGDLAHTASAEAEINVERDALGRPLSETVNGCTARYAFRR